LKNFQNDENLKGHLKSREFKRTNILFKLNLENFKGHLKSKNFKFLHCYNFLNFAFGPQIFKLTSIIFKKNAN